MAKKFSRKLFFRAYLDSRRLTCWVGAKKTPKKITFFQKKNLKKNYVLFNSRSKGPAQRGAKNHEFFRKTGFFSCFFDSYRLRKLLGVESNLKNLNLVEKMNVPLLKVQKTMIFQKCMGRS